MKFVLTFYLLFTILSFCQTEENHIWKPITSPNGEKFWYDPSTFDSVSNDKLNIWILESHRPPLKFEGIDGDVFRSKTLYTINLKTARYGLKKIRYYGLTNKELYSYDYDIYESDDIFTFPYPIILESKVHLVLQEFLKKKQFSK